MPKPLRSLDGYQLLLHLYPKTYRKEYGRQMTQTFQDMLNDCQTTADRTMIWLRAIFETPLNAAQETINTFSTKTIRKSSLTSNRGVTFSGGFLLATLLFSISIAHNQILSSSVQLFYGHSVNTTLTNTNTQLGDPFLSITGHTAKTTTRCTVIAQSLPSSKLDCYAGLDAYTKLGQAANDRTTILASVQRIEASLKAQKYQGGGNGVTLTSLVVGTYKGIDWSPDAFYQKTFGAYNCTLDTQVAYSKPQPPAIHMSLWCDRNVYILGHPSTPQIPIFDKNKG